MGVIADNSNYFVSEPELIERYGWDTSAYFRILTRNVLAIITNKPLLISLYVIFLAYLRLQGAAVMWVFLTFSAVIYLIFMLETPWTHTD